MSIVSFLFLVALSSSPSNTFAAHFSSPRAAIAAPAVISGSVLNQATGMPLADAIVRAGEVTTVTDASGQFTLAIDTTAQAARVIVTAPGFIDVEVDVPIVNGAGSVEVRLTLNPAYREEVTVSGQSAAVDVTSPTVVVEPLTVKRVAGSGDNVFRVLQTLPGVTAVDDFGSRLSVRGGGPDQNLTVMDGVEIHNPYRLFGLTSAFNPETIDRFELTAGGFTAKYGDRLSSILLVDNRVGNRNRRLGGAAALSATDANIVFEGGMPRGSWLLTGRRTYYDVVAERFTDSDLPSFNDLQAKAAWDLRPGQQLTFFALRSRETTDARFDGDIAGDTFGIADRSTNDVVSLSLSSTLGRRATSQTILAWYNYGDALSVDGSVRDEAVRSNAPDDSSFGRSNIVFTRDLEVRDFSLRQNLAFSISPTQTLTTGFDAHALRTGWGWTIAGDRNNGVGNGSSVIGGSGLPDLLSSSADSPRAGAFVEDDVRITPALRLAGGLRVDWNRLASETILSPRVRATFNLTPRTILRAAAGLYTQSPGYEKLLQSDYFVDLSNANSLGLQSERSVHVISGLEHTLGSLTARAEMFFKTFDRALVGRLETPDETAARVAEYDYPLALQSSIPRAAQITTLPTNSASGESYGFDFYVEKRQVGARDRLTGWLAYTWGKATLDNYGVRYPFAYDRRHSLSLVSTWRFLPRLDLGATLRVASGFPFTAPIGVRVASTLAPGATEGAPGSLIPRTDNGLYLWTTDYGGAAQLNRGRLPLYARLDLRFTYMRSPASRWQIYVEAINALNRENASSLTPALEYNPASDRPSVRLDNDGGLPFFPSFGLRFRF